jgi:16S rRNA (guanine1207-N2)-methyltransferase
MGEPAGHYFEASPASRSSPRSIRLDLPDRSLTLATDRGVFSPDRVDAGTKLLLLDGPPPRPDGVLVDLGCGYGAIACTLAGRAPGATVWAVDVNERAVALCRSNATSLGLTNVRSVLAADVPADLEVDEIWSNPPIRIGKAALHELLGSWLGRLRPAGRALLVVQKHLGADSLHAWIDGEGWAVERVAARGGYRVLEVRPA